MKLAPLVRANGANMPALGFGTWKLRGDEATRCVAKAAAVGYRHFDTAAAYENEAAVGEGLARSGLARDEYFLTTKVWPDRFQRADLLASARESLDRLKLDRVDLLLLHWPNPDVPLEETIEALNEAKAQGLASHIGVANFPVAQLEKAFALSEALLATDQCEYHPWLSQDNVLAACRAQGMAFTSYSPLGRGEALSDPLVARLGAAYGKSPGQIILRWHVQQDSVVAIPRSRSAEHIAENFDIFDFSLSDADMKALSGLARSDGRLVNPDFAPKWDD